MKKTACVFLCIFLTLSLSLCACRKGEESTAETTAPTALTEPATEAPTTNPATQDTPKKDKRYDLVALKQKADETYTAFNKIVSDNSYNGMIYMKIGNDFEYLSSTGSSDSAGHARNSLNTCFYTGSVTKQFTAAAVLRLAEEDKLSLDDTLDRFLPKYEKGKSITVENLLRMTSGVKNYIVPDEAKSDDYHLTTELDEIITADGSYQENKKAVLNWIQRQDLTFEPGERFEYSDSNYFLLGEVIAKASGKSYYDYIKESFLNPLGMGSTGFTADDHLAESYDGDAQSSKLCFEGVGYASFGMISNISDTLKWTDALLNGEVLSRESLDYMFADNGYDFGCGVYIKGKVISVTGTCGSYRSALKYRADRSEIYVSYTNYAYCDPTYLHFLLKKSLAKFEI